MVLLTALKENICSESQRDPKVEKLYLYAVPAYKTHKRRKTDQKVAQVAQAML